MIAFPDIDPVAFSLGPLSIRWYGLSYLAGIGLAWSYLAHRGPRQTRAWQPEQIADLVFYAALGAVIGGRVGYTLFYNAAEYVESPWSIFAVWRGGMSFHGGVIGFVIALASYARRSQRHFLDLSDFVVPAVPIGLGLGRIANFINQELWGAPTALPWGVVFTVPAAGGVPRYPTQLYEAMLEGACLFVLLHFLASRRPALGSVSAAFLIIYAVCRGLVEFVREPDAHIGYIAGGWLTMGQLLCVPMLVAGIGILLVTRVKRINP